MMTLVWILILLALRERKGGEDARNWMNPILVAELKAKY